MGREILPDEVWVVRFEWNRPGGVNGVTQELVTSSDQILELLTPQGRGRRIVNVEVYKMDTPPEEWRAYRWIPPSEGVLEEATSP